MRAARRHPWILAAVVVAAAALAPSPSAGAAASADERWYRLNLGFSGTTGAERRPDCGNSLCRKMVTTSTTLWGVNSDRPVFVTRSGDGGVSFKARVSGLIDQHYGTRYYGAYPNNEGGYCDSYEAGYASDRLIPVRGVIRTLDSAAGLRVRLRADNGDDVNEGPIIERIPDAYCTEYAECDPDYTEVCAPPGPDDTPEVRMFTVPQQQASRSRQWCCILDHAGLDDADPATELDRPAGTQTLIGPPEGTRPVAPAYAFRIDDDEWGHRSEHGNRLDYTVDYDFTLAHGSINEVGPAEDSWRFRTVLTLRPCPPRGLTHKRCQI